MDDSASKFMGAIVGAAIGESLGVRYEGAAGVREVTEPAPRFGGDTAMMIALAESYIEHLGFDYYGITNRFLKNYEREPWRRYKAGPAKLFRLMKSGRLGFGMLDRDLFPGGSLGNGAAARVAPVGLLFHDSPRQLRENAYHTAEITHSSELALEGAAIQSCAVALALQTDPRGINPDQFLGALKLFTLPGPYHDKLDSISRLLQDGADKKTVSIVLGNGPEAFNSVVTAIYAFLANTGFANAVIYAVSLGGNADAIGAMTGALAGACSGIDGIPEGWRKKVEQGEYLQDLGLRLHDAARSMKLDSRNSGDGRHAQPNTPR
jgi:poly(ADP-ribose) glycohydrolase ARH3